ncbi:hypothetical protein MMC25_001126 [Agyrium rufum]|nr:hypothetical protein [Agyrium rufum]
MDRPHSSSRDEPTQHRSHKRKASRREDSKTSRAPIALPFGATTLSKHDLKKYRPMFALYLDIQKQLLLEDLDEREIHGRWKSYVSKWNRRELAEGWYDPSTLKKAQNEAVEAASSSSNTYKPVSRPLVASKDVDTDDDRRALGKHSNDDSDDDEVGPELPNRSALSRHPRDSANQGPSVPSYEDLQLRREQEKLDSAAASQSFRHERKAHKAQQKAVADELAPRADPGTKARALEKRAEKRTANAAFASAKTDAGAEVPEMGEGELFGGEDDGIDALKRRKKEAEVARTDREIRREEIMRLRKDEREEKMKAYKRKEEETMKGLVEMAKSRFG